MANKLLKSLGLTGKKVSSQPSPSREYPTSSSVQELHSRSPTKARSSTSVAHRGSSSGTSSGGHHTRPDRDTRRHSDASTVRGSLPSARGVARGRVAGSPTVGWSLSRNNTDKDHRTGGHGDSATIASSSVRSRRTPRSDSVTHDDATKRSYNYADNSCGIHLQVTSISSDNLVPRILDEYSDPFDVKKEIEEVVKAEDTGSSPHQQPFSKDDIALAPEDDYSVPYELKNVTGDTEESDLPPEVKPEAETVATTPKYDDPYDESPVRLRSLSAVDDARSDSDAATSVALSSSYADSVTSTSDGKPSIGSSRNVSESSGGTASEINGGDCGSTTDSVQSGGQVDADPSGTYDEPWDLRAARLGIENRLRAAQTSNQAAHAMQHRPAGYESRYKTMDPRPAMEYDEPWDRRARDVQRSLISAKSAKEEARIRREGHGTASHLPQFVSSTCRKPDSVRHTDRSAKHAGGEVVCIHSASMMKHKCGSFDGGIPSWHPIAERIDPRIPLDQQGWYHGSISRLDAEGLLRVHREGSYLVRMSESNRCDFSLSLKSPRGFMHMKIVNCDDAGGCGGSHYILGQFSQPFDSIPQMIHHYTINKLPIKGAEHMSLLHPIHNELL